jgi:hypothetical protein
MKMKAAKRNTRIKKMSLELVALLDCLAAISQLQHTVFPR